jgi:glycosyltransferase involved in cell wall biosynthesis
MKDCTGTDKQPLVSIVMATYNPRIDWFQEQLVSLNEQSYKNLELLILDDCSSNVPFETIQECVNTYITRIPYELYRNEENLGSTKAFEKLTSLARGEYIAYCDQDDVWNEDKIETYVAVFSNSDTAIVFSDMNIIDGNGIQVADSITKIRKRHKFQSGAGLAKTLLFRNFVTGCAMVIRASEAKEAIPFCPFMVHDHWVALHCAVNGSIHYLNRSLVDYRVHENNQTLMLAGVADKKSYVDIRIKTPLNRFIWLKERLKEDQELSKVITQAIAWMTARRDNFVKRGSSVQVIWKYRRFSPIVSLFEIAAVFMPEKLFHAFIVLGRKNII